MASGPEGAWGRVSESGKLRQGTGGIWEARQPANVAYALSTEASRENLDLSGGLITAEVLALELGRQIGRQRSHDAMYEAAQASVTQSRPFREVLAPDPHGSAGRTPSQIETLLDPARYAGLCGELAKGAGAQGRAIAFAIELRVA